MTFTNDPPVVASVELIPDSDEKADLDSPSGSGGKLVIGQAPNITITETSVVADAAERLALDVQEGDVAIQTNVSSSFIFTGGDNIAPNWEVLDFDAVGAIDGEDINPSGIAGSNIGTAGQGQVLTSDGSGGLSFVTPQAGSEVVRNGSAIEYVALNLANLPEPQNPATALLVQSNQYAEFTPITADSFNIPSATFEKSINTQNIRVKGIAWNNDGSKLYEVDEVADKIFQSTVSTPFDITTASFDTSINTQDSFSTGIAWNDDGSRLYEIGDSSDNIYQYTVSNPFDISTASFQSSINTQDSTPTGIAWNDNGTRLYEVGRGGDGNFNGTDTLYQLTLSTPFEITTATFDTVIDTQDTNPQGIAWNNDGSRLYEVGQDSDKIYQYTVSNPFDISTASFQTSINTQDTRPQSIAWNNDGSRLYEAGLNNDKIYQYSLDIGGWEAI